jgi:hypothetical protein
MRRREIRKLGYFISAIPNQRKKTASELSMTLACALSFQCQLG